MFCIDSVRGRKWANADRRNNEQPLVIVNLLNIVCFGWEECKECGGNSRKGTKQRVFQVIIFTPAALKEGVT